MSELQFEFKHEGRTVLPGQVMHVHPAYHDRAGPSAKVERYYGDTVMLRTDNGAVPTVPIHALSWEPHPETLAREAMSRVGIKRLTDRDVSVWMTAIRSVQASREPVALLRKLGPRSWETSEAAHAAMKLILDFEEAYAATSQASQGPSLGEGESVGADEEVMADAVVDHGIAGAAMSTEPVAAAWNEGYQQGVKDERTSEANIGIAGFRAKVEPARQNPYGTASPPAQPAEPAAPLHDDLTQLINRLENQSHRMGELWERCQGRGWPEKADAEFRFLRDEKTPETRAAIAALAADQVGRLYTALQQAQPFQQQTQNATQRLEQWLEQFGAEEQEQLIQYALDHVIPKLKQLKEAAAGTPVVRDRP